jgi:hypothetical protein
MDFGNDGGLYETGTRRWNVRHFDNLPISAVLSDRGGQRAAVLSRLRRAAGQQLDVRTVALDQRAAFD